MTPQVTRNVTALDKDGIKGISRYLADDLELVELSLIPGAELFKHALPIPVIFYVLQGTGLLTVDAEEFTGNEQDIFECPPAINRTWRNIGTQELKLLVIKKTN